MIIITNQQELDELCLKLGEEKILYMDTEFQRRRTYYAILSIVQISTTSQKIIIDALTNINLEPLKKLLVNNNIVKVFHSAEQDFEIFLHRFGVLPNNVFDTQIAAYVCGFDENAGYSRLCKQLLNVDIDKSLQNADWLARPLSPKLLEYAIRDTEFLIPLHRTLSEIIASRKLQDNFNMKIAKLTDANSYKFSADKILSKMRLHRSNPAVLERLKYFITFREDCARILNIPRSHCASDEDLVLMATKLPKTDSELQKLKLHYLPIAKPKFKQKLFDMIEGLEANLL